VMLACTMVEVSDVMRLMCEWHDHDAAVLEAR
jgi:hypothetical protein